MFCLPRTIQLLIITYVDNAQYVSKSMYYEGMCNVLAAAALRLDTRLYWADIACINVNAYNEFTRADGRGLPARMCVPVGVVKRATLAHIRHPDTGLLRDVHTHGRRVLARTRETLRIAILKARCFAVQQARVYVLKKGHMVL
jgi:hypothetical protein